MKERLINNKMGVVKYYGELKKTLHIINIIQISLVITIFLLVVDEYDGLTKCIRKLPTRVRIILAIGLILFVLLWLVNIHIIDLFKINTVNVVDKVFFILFIIGVGTSIYWGIVQKGLNNKFIVGIILFISVVILWIVKIKRYINNEVDLTNSDRYIYDLQQIYENTFEVRDNEPLLILEKDVDYDLLKRDNIINQPELFTAMSQKWLKATWLLYFN